MKEHEEEDLVRELVRSGRSRVELPEFEDVAARSRRHRSSRWWQLAAPVLIVVAALVGTSLGDLRGDRGFGLSGAPAPTPSPREMDIPDSCGKTPTLGYLPVGVVGMETRTAKGLTSTRYEAPSASLVVSVSWTALTAPLPGAEVRQVGPRSVTFQRIRANSGGTEVMAWWIEQDLLCPFVTLVLSVADPHVDGVAELSRVTSTIRTVHATLRPTTRPAASGR